MSIDFNIYVKQDKQSVLIIGLEKLNSAGHNNYSGQKADDI